MTTQEKLNITHDEIKASILSEAKKDNSLERLTNANSNSVFMRLVNWVSGTMFFFFENILKNIYDSIWVDTADDTALLLHAQQAGITRKPASTATVMLRVGSKKKPVRDVTILQGAMFRTAGEKKLGFVATHEAIVNTSTEKDALGFYTVEVLAKAESSGSVYNVLNHSITEFEYLIEDIDVVYNPLAASGGEEQEDNESIRRRLQIVQNAYGWGTKSWFKAEALKFDFVGSVTVLPRYKGLGTVGIIASGKKASLLTNAQLLQVQNYFSSEEIDPAGAFHVLVEAPQIKLLDFSIVVYYLKNHKPTDVFLDAIVREYVQGLKLGEEVILTALEAKILSAGLKDVQISLPSENVTLANNELAKVNSVVWQKKEYGSD